MFHSRKGIPKRLVMGSGGAGGEAVLQNQQQQREMNTFTSCWDHRKIKKESGLLYKQKDKLSFR